MLSRWIVPLIIVLLPLYQVRWTLFGIPTTLLELSLSVLTIACIFNTPGSIRERIKNFFTISDRPLSIAVLLFLVAGTLAATLPATAAAFGIWKAYIIDALLAFFITRWATREEGSAVERIAASASLLLTFIVLVSLAQWWGWIPINDPIWSKPETFRATSIFLYPNAVGLLAAPLTVLIAGFIARDRFSPLLAIGFFSGIASIAFAQSQGAMLAVVAGLLVILLFPMLSHRMRKASAMGIVMFVLILPFLPIQRPLAEYFNQSPSALLRLEQWQETKELLQKNPFFGGGMANYQNAIAPYHNTERSGVAFLYPHQLTLALWTELGLFGLLAFWTVITLSLSAALNRPTALPILGALFALLVHGLVDVPYFKNDLSVLTWILIALALPSHLLSATRHG